MIKKDELLIRQYDPSDENAVIKLWHECGLVVPHNDPKTDIEKKMQFQPQWFFVGVVNGNISSTIMVGYEGRRGWINYLAVSPEFQRRGYGKQMMERAEVVLKKVGCLKINLQVRETNKEVIYFYKSLGYSEDNVISMGKRLNQHDNEIP